MSRPGLLGGTMAGGFALLATVVTVSGGRVECGLVVHLPAALLEGGDSTLDPV
jgi:hypothetical protein